MQNFGTALWQNSWMDAQTCAHTTPQHDIPFTHVGIRLAV